MSVTGIVEETSFEGSPWEHLGNGVRGIAVGMSFELRIAVGGIDAVFFLGNEASWREHEDQVKRAIFIMDPTQGFKDRDGTVVGWNVYTTRGRRSQVVHLQIWRPVNPAIHQYLRIGETVITALWVGHSLFAPYPEDRIRIQRGDVLGIYFPGYNPIPWSAAPCTSGNEHLFRYNPVRLHNYANETVFERGSPDSNPCRKYSINATIMNDQELKQYDQDYEETTDGRYDRRPYGRHLPIKRWPYSDIEEPSAVEILHRSKTTWLSVSLAVTVAFLFRTPISLSAIAGYQD